VHVSSLKRLVPLVGVLLGCNAVLGIEKGERRPGTVSCTTHTECLARTGEYDPSMCIQGECVKLITQDCPLLLPAEERGWFQSLTASGPEPVLFGAFLEMPQGQQYATASRNFDLALTEFTRTVGGLPTVKGLRRPVLALVCRSQYDDTDALDAATDHLIDELQVPGILSKLETNDLVREFQRAGHDHHVFFMSPLGSDNDLVGLNDDGLVWAELPGGAAIAPTYGPLLDLTVEHLRKTGALGNTEKVRVALVIAEDYVPMREMGEALTDVIEPNGEPAGGSSYFRSFMVPSINFSTTSVDYSDATQALVKFAPQVVISAASDEFLSVFIPALDAASPKHPPTYLLSPANWNRPTTTSLLTSSPDLRMRLLGVNYAAAEDASNYTAYQRRFEAAFPGQRSPGYENFYDASYHLIYSAIAVGPNWPFEGTQLALGMNRLIGGRDSFNVGPDDLQAAFLHLQTQTGNIALNGAMGPPDFDATGARSDPGTVYCYDDELTLRPDVLRLTADGTLTGEFPCFDFP